LHNNYSACKPSTETTQFFKALRQVGTDFTMMTLLIPKRSRRELKVIDMSVTVLSGLGVNGKLDRK
jgi:hypothetical protein